ncbi:uncharacterized protein RHO25_011293 [Cercospora beticola]|uniref:Uncharacterized protein n=1 Tax=Cercospora beticola TaxID=122368 RepID=A0ABZ0P4I5_CERBT|nr:hypothetical protein RHO25_011293 [Cercospora beticola]CAK1366553.1 unnamed protein product [Cercospora beticola]
MNNRAITQNGLRSQEVPHIAQRSWYHTADLNFVRPTVLGVRATDQQAGGQYNGSRLPRTKQSTDEIMNQIKALTVTHSNAGPRDVPFKFAT